MTRFSKFAGATAALAVTASSFSPAMAAVTSAESASPMPSRIVDVTVWQESDTIAEHRRHRRHRHYRHRRGGVDAGDVIAGVLILGGIAAIADAASKNNRRERRDERYDPRYEPRYEPREEPRYNDSGELNRVADQCAMAAEQRAGRDARVERISTVARDGNGWRVDGVVDTGRGSETFQCGVSDGRVDYIQMDEPVYDEGY